MRVFSMFAVLLVSVATMAQSAACPSNRPVDDYITEIHKSHSSRKARNKNPLPDFVCVFGWCKQAPKKPATASEPPAGENGQVDSTSPASIKCDLEMQQVLDAAHDVDVGDTYFEEKNFHAALFRYQDALKAKPDDAAILVRLGRAYEKLNQPDEAARQYADAAKLPGPEKWVQEARDSLARLSKSH